MFLHQTEQTFQMHGTFGKLSSNNDKMINIHSSGSDLTDYDKHYYINGKIPKRKSAFPFVYKNLPSVYDTASPKCYRCHKHVRKHKNMFICLLCL